MSVRTETLQLRVVVDGTPARKELAGLDQEYAKLNSEIKGLKSNTQEYIAAAARMETIKGRQAELRKEIGDTALTAKQLTDELKRLQVAQRNLTPNTAQWTENANRIEVVKQRLRELNDVNARASAAWEVQRKSIALVNMTMEQLELESRRLGAALRTMDPNSREFVNLRRELNAVDGRMQQLRTGLGPFGRAWAEVKTQVMGAGAVLGAFLAGGAILQTFKSLVTGAAELSDAQADVQRTTGMTKVEVDELTKSVGQLNTRTARSELLALAADAGKLGRAKEEVLQFVRAGDQIRVALGEDLGEDAIKNIGKLNQTFQVGRATGKDLEGQMLATGSAINALGQSSTAQESYLVDFATRMAGVNTQANINIQSTLGYAATLDQLGQRSETASTALSQFTLKAFQNTAEYAKIAGMGLEDFTSLLNTDTNEALLRVLQGLKGNNEGLSRMTGLFGDLGQEGARAVSVLASLANNTDLVRQQQAIANKEFTAATSITAEFNAKNSTLAANLDIIGKRLMGAFVNSGVVRGINNVAQGLRDMVSPTIADGIENERQALFKLYSQILSTNEGSTERIKLVNELQAKYPTMLANLNAETAGNNEVAEAVKLVNAQLINRIILAEQQEKVDEQNQVIADTRRRRLELEDEVLKKLEAGARKYGVELQGGATVLEQSQKTYALIKAAQDKILQGRSGGGVLVNDVARLGVAIGELASVQAFENSESNVGNRLLQEKVDLMKRLGITAEEAAGQTVAAVNPQVAPTVDVASAAGGLSDAEREKLKNQWEQWKNDLGELRESIYQSTLSDDERDIRQLDVKHARELAKLRANGAATQADILALEESQQAERIALIEGQGEERLGKYSEAANKIRRATLDAAQTELEDELAKWSELIALGEKYGLDVSELVEEREKARAAITKKWRDKELADEEKSNADSLAAFKKSMQARIDLMQGFATLAGSVAGLIDAVKQVEEQRADADGVRTQEEIQRINELENRRRTAALVQIALSSASGVAQAIQAGAGVPFPGNLVAIAAGVAAVLSGIAQAYTLLKLSSTNVNNAQSASSGSNLQNVPIGEKGGVFEGPGHDQGGLKVYDPQRQKVVAEVEGGEPWMVLSRAFRRNNAGLIPLLLRASATGQRLHLAEHGGVFGAVRPFNFTKASEAIHLAAGGVLDSKGTKYVFRKGTGGMRLEDEDPTRNKGANGKAMQEMIAVNKQLLAAMNNVVQGVSAIPSRLHAVVSNQDFDRTRVEFDKLRDRAKVKRR